MQYFTTLSYPLIVPYNGYGETSGMINRGRVMDEHGKVTEFSSKTTLF